MKEDRVSETNVLPELAQIVGAMLFAAKGPVSPDDVRRCLRQVAEERGGIYRDLAEAPEQDILAAIEQVRERLREARIGVHVNEIAAGFRMENDANCGPWLRALLQKGRPNRLSRPALETLAVIAYRQPCTRAEIEAVRGVAVDQILRNLIDLQLIRITGRSELPGRPWQFGTTQKFLEYFGLKSVKDLPGIEELRRMEAEQEARRAAAQEKSEPALVELPPSSPQSERPSEPDSPSSIFPDRAESGPDAGFDDGEKFEDNEDEYDDEDDEDDQEEEAGDGAEEKSP
jgi:segregation and condensation protein B